MQIMTLPGNEPVTMTSLELVAYINEYREDQAKAAGAAFPSKGFAKLEHADFMKKVPEVLGGGVGNFSDTYLHPQNGQTYDCYRFPKREACLMAMSYSYELQAKVFDRMTALEEKPAAIDPQEILRDPAAMRGLLLGYTEKVLELESKVNEQAPKVAAFDRIATSDGSLCITDAAKTLQMQPRKFTQFLLEQHYTYRRPMGAGWLAYQDKIQQGLMEHKVTRGEKSDGTEWTSTQPRITAKGLTKLASVLQQNGMH